MFFKSLYSSNSLFIAQYSVFEAGLFIGHGVADDQAGIYLINFVKN